MRPLSRDTHPDAERVQLDLLRAASPARKFALSQAMTATALTLQRRALRAAHPLLDEREIGLMVVAINYGPELADKVRACLLSRDA